MVRMERDMIGLDVARESTEFTDGLDGRYKGKRGIRMTPTAFGFWGWWYHLQNWSRLGRTGLA